LEINKISQTRLDNRLFFNNVSAFICVHPRLIFAFIRHFVRELLNSFVENVKNAFVPVPRTILSGENDIQ
jgi:hypothetical protein